MRKLMRGLFAFALIAAALTASAQAHPERAVHFVVPNSAGGITDLAARVIAKKLTEMSGQPVLVANRVGAGGIVGTNFVAKSAPDGYTIIMGVIAGFAINPSVYANLPYSPVRDFGPSSMSSPCRTSWWSTPRSPRARSRMSLRWQKRGPARSPFPQLAAVPRSICQEKC